jgi:ClpX C4-type zinc finger
MTSNTIPPPVLVGARVLTYAATDSSVTYTGRSTLHVDGELLGAVPHLVICQNFGAKNVLLLYCDEAWNSLVASEHTSIKEAKERAEIEYRGVSTKWHDANVSEEEAKLYMEEHWGDQRCSFCGKQPEQIERMFQSAYARICNECVEAFHKNPA